MSTTTTSTQISALLPPDARAILTRAATEAKSMTNELDRENHMERAIAKVRNKYPSYFERKS